MKVTGEQDELRDACSPHPGLNPHPGRKPRPGLNPHTADNPHPVQTPDPAHILLPSSNPHPVDHPHLARQTHLADNLQLGPILQPGPRPYPGHRSPCSASQSPYSAPSTRPTQPALPLVLQLPADAAHMSEHYDTVSLERRNLESLDPLPSVLSGDSDLVDFVNASGAPRPRLPTHCDRLHLRGRAFTSKISDAEVEGKQGTLFPPSPPYISTDSCHHVTNSQRKASSSSWTASGQRSCATWKQSSSDRLCGSGHRSPQSPEVSHQAAGMTVVAMQRRFRWLGVGLGLTAFFYVLLYFNSAVWSSLNQQPQPLPNSLTGSGFRKLLEDQEKARLYVNVSSAGWAQRLPSCIIIGVRKCGTRALLDFLNLHPDIVAVSDEMHFFNDDERYRLGLERYRSLMPLSLPHQITMEKTPGYFISRIAPSRVHRMNSSIKLIVLLRHPTTRTISDYTQVYYNRMSKDDNFASFEDIVIDEETGGVNTRYKAVQISMYHHHFRHWTEVFPRSQIHVVDGDRLITDPVSEIQDVETFLGIQHRVDYTMLYYNSTRGFYCMRKNATYDKCLGASKGRKHPDIKQSVVRKLNKFFQPHNKVLFDLIKRRFSWS